jgi:hypothetical protein
MHKVMIASKKQGEQSVGGVANPGEPVVPVLSPPMVSGSEVVGAAAIAPDGE